MLGIADVMQTGKRALVTGAGGGVGKGIALVLATMPLRRTGTVDDTAGAVLFLVSGLSSWVTAQTVIVDGGAMVCARVEGPRDVPPLDQPQPAKRAPQPSGLTS